MVVKKHSLPKVIVTSIRVVAQVSERKYVDTQEAIADTMTQAAPVFNYKIDNE